MKIFISQPMRGKTEDEILTERIRMIRQAKEKYGSVEVLDSYFGDYNGNALGFLGKSIELLGEADAAVFAPGWKDFRGCRMEYQCCCEYDVPILEVQE